MPTTVVIDCDYSVTSVFVDSNPLRDDTGSMNCGVDNGPTVLRIALRFDMSSIPVNSNVTAAKVLTEQWQSFDVSAKTWRYGPFDGDGLADPETVTDLELRNGCDLASTAYGTTTAHRTDGSKEVSIIGGASDIEAAINAAGTYTVVIQDTDEETQGRLFRIYGADQAPNPIPQLSITYEAAAAASAAAPLFWRWRN